MAIAKIGGGAAARAPTKPAPIKTKPASLTQPLTASTNSHKKHHGRAGRPGSIVNKLA
jgi:hypothetical protein